MNKPNYFVPWLSVATIFILKAKGASEYAEILQYVLSIFFIYDVSRSNDTSVRLLNWCAILFVLGIGLTIYQIIRGSLSFVIVLLIATITTAGLIRWIWKNKI